MRARPAATTSPRRGRVPQGGRSARRGRPPHVLGVCVRERPGVPMNEGRQRGSLRASWLPHSLLFPSPLPHLRWRRWVHHSAPTPPLPARGRSSAAAAILGAVRDTTARRAPPFSPPSSPPPPLREARRWR